jgi:ATP-dependent RNA helicase SUPV3L1/SUV3
MTGSVNALEAVKKIAAYLEEDLIVEKFKRKNELELLDKHTALGNLESGTALIAFSRSDVLKLKQKLQKKHKISIIYGNLSPEVRRDEARRFRDKETDILIATDAIAMGLNLPIKTILFTTHMKFDGISRRGISVNEIVQIAGRAGRYGHHEKGFIGATTKDSLKYIKEEYSQPIKTIKPPFKVKINNEQLTSLAMHLKTTSLTKVLKFFSTNMVFEGPFIAANIGSMISASTIVDQKFNLKLEDKYMLAQAPISVKSKIILQAYDIYISAVLKNRVIRYKPSITLPKVARTQKDLLLVEDEIKKISLYLWLSYKLPEQFPDSIKATIARTSFNQFMENSLKKDIKLAPPENRRPFPPREKREFKPRRRF